MGALNILQKGLPTSTDFAKMWHTGDVYVKNLVTNFRPQVFLKNPDKFAVSLSNSEQN